MLCLKVGYMELSPSWRATGAADQKVAAYKAATINSTNTLD